MEATNDKANHEIQRCNAVLADVFMLLGMITPYEPSSKA